MVRQTLLRHLAGGWVVGRGLPGTGWWVVEQDGTPTSVRSPPGKGTRLLPETCLMRQVAMHAHAARKNRQNVCRTEGNYVILRIYGFRAGSAYREGGCNTHPEINKLPACGRY